jgi:hypothetical protein
MHAYEIFEKKFHLSENPDEISQFDGSPIALGGNAIRHFLVWYQTETEDGCQNAKILALSFLNASPKLYTTVPKSQNSMRLGIIHG